MTDGQCYGNAVERPRLSRARGGGGGGAAAAGRAVGASTSASLRATGTAESVAPRVLPARGALRRRRAVPANQPSLPRLSAFDLPGFLRGIETRRASGVLHLVTRAGETRLYFRSGALVFAGSDAHEELGMQLATSGKIRPSAFHHWRREEGANAKRDLVEFLVEMGHVSRQTVRLAQMQQMMAIIESVLQWDSAAYRFVAADTPVESGREVPLSVTELLFAAARKASDGREVVRRLRVSGETRVRALEVEDDRSRPTRVELTAAELPVLRLLESLRPGSLSLRELVTQSPSGQQVAMRSVYALFAIGAVDLLPEGSAASKGRGWKGPPVAATPVSSGKPRYVGRFQILCRLGSGSSGQVFLARDPNRPEPVALKLLPAPGDVSAATLERRRRTFYRDAQARSALQHPGLLPVVDLGCTEANEPFLVTEFVDAYTLEILLQARELSFHECRTLFQQVLDAAAFGHAAGFLHGRLSPAKVFVFPDLSSRIRDFGLPQPIGSGSEPGARPRLSHQALPYLAPEQIHGGVGDPRSDVYALGVILYQMLTRHFPTEGDQSPDRVHERLTQDPVPPSVFNRQISKELNRFVLRCLARRPAGRFRDAGEAARAFTAAVSP